MATVARPRVGSRVVTAGLVGSVVEYFDFGVYGYLATVLSVVFFAAGTDPTAALLATFAAFAASFVLRPLGGLLFGHLGDRWGRSKTLAATVLLMCAATVVIGVLPTYAAIGVGATFLLVAARCLQGVAAGGEIGGAAAFVAERAPDARRGFYCSTVQIGALGGALLASALVTVLTTVLTPEQLIGWGWRVPFLLSLPMGLVGLWIRSRIEDSEQFRALASEGATAAVPAVELVRTQMPGLLRTLGLSCLLFAGYYVVYVYAATHLQRVGGLGAASAFWSTTVTLVVSCATIPIFGMASDRWGRRPVLLAASTAMLVLAVPCFLAMGSGVLALSIVAQAVLGLPQAALMAVAFATFAELFTAKVRYSGIALGYNLAGMALGGTAPLISVALISATANPTAPAWFLMATAVVTIATALTLTETAGTPLRA